MNGPRHAALAGRLQEHGYRGLWDYRKRKPSPKRVPMQLVEQVLQLYREKYFDFNVQHFHEKLREVHGIHYELHVGEDGAANGRPGEAAQ